MGGGGEGEGHEMRPFGSTACQFPLAMLCISGWRLSTDLLLMPHTQWPMAGAMKLLKCK